MPEIFTFISNAFQFGGTGKWSKTEVEEFERISLGKGFFGILVKNPIKKLWHLAEESSGALVGTSSDKESMIKSVKKDIEQCKDLAYMTEQVEEQIERREQSLLIPNKEFFSSFKEKRR